MVQRPAVPGNAGYSVEELEVAIQLQGKAAHQMVLGRLEFGLGGAFLDKLCQQLAHQAQCRVGLVRAGLQADGEGPGVQAWGKVAVHAVGQATLLAHRIGQARGKAAATQDVVAHHQRQVIGVGAPIAGLAQQYLGLGTGKGHNDVACRCQRGHFGHRGPGRAIVRTQAAEQLAHQRIGLGTVQRPHHRHAGIAGSHHLRVQRRHVAHLQAAQAGLGHFTAIGMVAVHGRIVGALRQHTGAGARLAQAGDPLGAVALPQGCGKRGFGQLARSQGDGTGE